MFLSPHLPGKASEEEWDRRIQKYQREVQGDYVLQEYLKPKCSAAASSLEITETKQAAPRASFSALSDQRRIR